MKTVGITVMIEYDDLKDDSSDIHVELPLNSKILKYLSFPDKVLIIYEYDTQETEKEIIYYTIIKQDMGVPDNSEFAVILTVQLEKDTMGIMIAYRLFNNNQTL